MCIRDRLLRDHGLQAGDSIALVCANRAEFADVLFAWNKRKGHW